MRQLIPVQRLHYLSYTLVAIILLVPLILVVFDLVVFIQCQRYQGVFRERLVQ